MNNYNNNEIVVRLDHNVIDNTAVPQGTKDQPAVGQSAPKMQSGGIAIAKTVGVMALKKGMQYGVTNFGNLTGDYLTQSSINSAIEISGLVGMAATGPLGLAVATVSVGFKALDFYTTRAKQDQNISYLRERTATWNGSR